VTIVAPFGPERGEACSLHTLPGVICIIGFRHEHRNGWARIPDKKA
jgi:hypothetical protein